MVYDWRIHAEKPLLRTFSFMLKPIFSANHHWAMRMGEQSLKLELARRHARTAEERARVPPTEPPDPSTPDDRWTTLGDSSAKAFWSPKIGRFWTNFSSKLFPSCELSVCTRASLDAVTVTSPVTAPA